MADRYSGPVLFEGDAAAELFSEKFARHLVGTPKTVVDNRQFESMFGFDDESRREKTGAHYWVHPEQRQQSRRFRSSEQPDSDSHEDARAAELRAELLRIANQRGKDYGIVVRKLGTTVPDASSGMSMSGSGGRAGARTRLILAA